MCVPGIQTVCCVTGGCFKQAITQLPTDFSHWPHLVNDVGNVAEL